MTRLTGRVPDYGAIFVANKRTKNECFDRELFGAPSWCRQFVKQIKAGMVLFLFQYDTKKLYGVFQAITDGRLDIVPEAYRKAGGPFPAQVCFSEIWRCTPLSEDEFRGAIWENFYTSNKFHFGLSKDQVKRLLSLFYSKKITVLKTLNENKMNIKRFKASDEENHCRTSGIPSLEEGEVEISEIGTQSSTPVNVSEDLIASSETPSSGLEDYIPLPSPDRDDIEEKVTTFLDSVIKEDQSKPACEESIVPKVFGNKDLNQGLIFDGCKKSSPVKEKPKKSPIIKSLYADSNNKRKGVFSRLNLEISRSDTVEIEVDLQSPGGLMKKLQKLHKKWKKLPTKNEEKNEDRSSGNRVSTFSRLSVAEEEHNEKKRKTKARDESISKNEEICPYKIRRNNVFLRLQSVLKERELAASEDTPRPKKLIKSVIVHKSDITQRNENVVELSPKPLLTYYRRRRRLSGSGLAEESKLSFGANEEDAEK